MKTISRYIMTLALLIMAVTGAWADGVTMKEITSSDIQSSWNGNTDPVKATDLPGFKAMTHDEAVALGAPSNNEKVYLIYAINASNKFAALIYESGTKSSNETEFNLNELQSTAQNYWVYYTYSDAPAEPDETPLVTIESKDYTSFKSGSMTFDDKVTVTFSGTVINNGDGDGWNFYDSDADPITMTITAAKGYTITSVKLTIGSATLTDNEAPFEATLYGSSWYPKTTISDQASGIWGGVTKIEVYGTASAGIEVITDAAEEGATFTEASFEMPASDVTAEYELVRDMSVQMTATMGDGTDGVRYRVKKAQQGEGYEPADMNMMQVLALVAVNDGIEQKALTLDQDYFCRIYKLDEQTLQPLSADGVNLADFDFAPGLYALKAFAKDDSDYDGETALSNTFQLFQGYEVEVAAKEFITYYKDEPLYVEDEAAELYTISSVNGDQAVLSEKSDAMPSNTPMLVYNKSNETKVILLIPCAEPDMAITVAPEFQGTLTATTIAASTDAQTNYALNGKQFVFVKDAIEIGANKAWLSIPSGMIAGARALNIVFSDATGISTTNYTNFTNGDWYDLNGRKLDKMPTKKGVYIMNGRKVVVK